MSKARWHIRDIIDFEYFLLCDEKEEETTTPASLAKRDRTIYLEQVQPMETRGQALPVGRTLRIWLDQRRNMEKSKTGAKAILPGETFDEIFRVVLYLLMIIGLTTGAGLAFSFLNYKGTEPVNVTAYLGGFVLTQLLLLLFLFLMLLFRSWKNHPLRSSIIFILITGLIGKLLTRVKRSSLKALSGSKRDMLEGTIALVQGKRRVYGNLFYWPVFLSSQLFMVAFNVGVLSATLLKVLGSDIAFGWQSTIQLGSHFVFNLVKTIALPWSWFVPTGTAYPTLAQIEGTHMVLKDGIYHLETMDLVSWWPFLCLCLLFYGLLPRIIVLILGLTVEKRAISRIGFLHGAPARLYNRMKTPNVTTQGVPVEMKGDSIGDTHPIKDSKYQTGVRSGRDLIALIPDEIFDTCPFDELRDLVFQRRGAQILFQIKLTDENQIDPEQFKREENPDVMILQESWQPPIRESLFLLKDLRRAIGNSSKIILGLIGRPREDIFFTRIKADDYKAWENKIKTLEDPYLELERLEINAG